MLEMNVHASFIVSPCSAITIKSDTQLYPKHYSKCCDITPIIFYFLFHIFCAPINILTWLHDILLWGKVADFLQSKMWNVMEDVWKIFEEYSKQIEGSLNSYYFFLNIFFLRFLPNKPKDVIRFYDNQPSFPIFFAFFFDEKYFVS